MNLECSKSKDGVVVRLNGEMDAVGCAHVRPDLEQITHSDANTDVVLDLSLVSFLDSSGVGVIVFLYKRLKAQGRNLEICGVRGQPQELMDLLRIDQVIRVNRVSSSNATMNCDYA